MNAAVAQMAGEHVFCHAASLADAGTHLLLSPEQIEWEDEWNDDECRFYAQGIAARSPEKAQYGHR